MCKGLASRHKDTRIHERGMGDWGGGGGRMVDSIRRWDGKKKEKKVNISRSELKKVTDVKRLWGDPVFAADAFIHRITLHRPVLGLLQNNGPLQLLSAAVFFFFFNLAKAVTCLGLTNTHKQEDNLCRNCHYHPTDSVLKLAAVLALLVLDIFFFFRGGGSGVGSRTNRQCPCIHHIFRKDKIFSVVWLYKPVSPCVLEMDDILATWGILFFFFFERCTVGGVYVPCITCMPGRVTVGNSGLWCCVPCLMSATNSFVCCTLKGKMSLEGIEHKSLFVCFFLSLLYFEGKVEPRSNRTQVPVCLFLSFFVVLWRESWAKE